MRALPLLAVLGLLLAGCTSAPPPEEEPTPVPAATFAWDEPAAGTEAGEGEAASGSTPAPAAVEATTPPTPSPAMRPDLTAPVVRTGANVTFRAACAGACPESLFAVEAAPGARLEVRVAWNGTLTRGFALEVVTPEGALLRGERGFDSARVLVVEPKEGFYTVRLGGLGEVGGLARMWTRGEPRGAEGDLAPNLVTLVPAGVAVSDCDPWERVEQKAATCLRMGNGIGNVGDGPLEVALAPDQGLLTPLGSGRFMQRIYQEKGEPREAPVGAAAFHPTHAHYHYDGLARFSLHPVDPATGLRGAAVSTHHKAGFCLLDIGEMEEADADPEPEGGQRAEQACLVPGGQDGWTMGVSRGYYDYYGAGLTDQYVEITGVPDGLYELVSECNWSGSLHELDRTDNAASVLVKLSSGKADVVEERGFYRLPG